jgi:uncharacterized SAM-binding protein YcdF (DUF218 family)
MVHGMLSLRRLFFILLLMMGGACVFLSISFTIFLNHISERHSANMPIDAVKAAIVLTGGSGRLEVGIELLSQEKIQHLFISGVYKGVEVTELLHLLQKSPEKLSCCITLGFEATNTKGNAYEAVNWLKENDGYKNILLVTSSYHMPRSMVEFQRAFKKAKFSDINITPFAVQSPNVAIENWAKRPATFLLLFTEHIKWFIAILLSYL